MAGRGAAGAPAAGRGWEARPAGSGWPVARPAAGGGGSQGCHQRRGRFGCGRRALARDALSGRSQPGLPAGRGGFEVRSAGA
ncbi:hypothetical protein CNX65_25915 [Actinosynnema pretiosum]|uniref:Uncharacterized protein n=1 Tax=Actinosynnema pretiosum TaxID=42197 RepID=A0A290ZB67_9PSEU|nr:hypothetical protein CNX65_25915 [Actinosynnema pretiosum]